MRPALTRFLTALPACALLAACGGEAAPEPAQDDRLAEGEVLGGSISDDMLPLDTRRSQSPTIREAPAPAAAAPESSGDSAEEPEAEPPPPPAPADPAAE